MDYQTKISDDYLSLFQEDGWELTWSGAGGWSIWQKSYENERPEIFTDSHSLIERNHRIRSFLIPIFACLIVIFIGLLLMNRDEFKLILYVYVVLISLYSYMFYQFSKFDKKLKDTLKD